MNDLALTNEKIEQVEAKMLQLPQADCPVEHRFAPGLYIRQVTLPAGILAIGHEQLTEHFNVMLCGKVLMINKDGTREIIKAPQSFTGQPGRKVGFILETTVWLNIYATDETDIDKLEAQYLRKSETFLLNEAEHKSAETVANEINRLDYKAMLQETGFTEPEARAMAENKVDQIDMPIVHKPYRIAESAIEGKGYFLTAPAKAGDVLAPARIDGKRTPAGRYCNHSMTPNARFDNHADGNIYLIALRDIHGAQGGGIGEEVTVDYRQSIKLVRAESCPE